MTALSGLIALAIFSGLSLNLLLQFGLGISGVIPQSILPGGHVGSTFWKLNACFSLVLCISVFVLWLFFTYVLTPLALGFLESFLLFPLCAAACAALELLFSKQTNAASAEDAPEGNRAAELPAHLRGVAARRGFPVLTSISAYNGLALAALLITLRLASSPAEALALTLGLSLGRMAAVLILREIYKRSCLETVPRILRGFPLILISMGLLSLIFSAAAVIFYRILVF
jgi:electron transport complex protein RnfA